MTIVLSKPGVDGLGEAVSALREWQHDEAPLQLHPGDVGWFWRAGAEATAAAVRTWSRGGRILAVGLLDGPDLVRVTSAPDAQQDEELARQMVEDMAEPERGVLPAGKVYVEAPTGALVREVLFEARWDDGEPWTPLRHDLTEPVKNPGVRVEVIGPEQADVRAAVHRASFGARSSPTRGGTRWRPDLRMPTLDAGRVRRQDNAVAAVTVWSAGQASPDCSSRWGCTRTIAATATARRSPSPRRPHSGNWARRARWYAPRTPMSELSPPTSPPASSASRRGWTSPGRLAILGRQRPRIARRRFSGLIELSASSSIGGKVSGCRASM